MSEHTQLSLPFEPEGEGDKRHIMTDDSISRNLKNKAEETYKLIMIAKTEYDRESPYHADMVRATKGHSHEHWVMYRGERCGYWYVRSMLRFIEDYASQQCGRIELLRALIAALAVRGIEINIDEKILQSEGC